MAKTKIALLYERLSRDDELSGESFSIQNQRDMLEKYCEKQGWGVVAVYQDDGFTGLRACLKSFDKNGGVGDNRKKQAGAGENASIPK